MNEWKRMLAFSLCRSEQLSVVTSKWDSVLFQNKSCYRTVGGNLSGLWLIKMSSILKQHNIVSAIFLLLPSFSDTFALCSFPFIKEVSFPRELFIFVVFCSGMDVKAYLRSMIPHLESGMKLSKSKDMYVQSILKCSNYISNLEIDCHLCNILTPLASGHCVSAM